MTGYWQANLRVLAGRDDAASRRLLGELAPAGPAADGGLRDRQGRPLPTVDVGGRPRSLVSAYDAVQEARRWAEPFEGGTAAVLGGAGRDAAQALADRGARLLFWIEPRLDVWRTLFTWEDWTAAAADPDWVPVFTSPAEWSQLLPRRYHPLWDGAFRSYEWRAAGPPPAGWPPYLEAARKALEGVAGDASTQARFGERWYRNSLRNLRDLAAADLPGCSGARVVAAGAGPSLDDALENPAELRWLAGRRVSGDRLFATDTALPALAARNAVPDAVFSLDGQLATYHHYAAGLPAGVPVVADLASLPLLGRLGVPVVRYLSGHPFGAVVRRFFPELPVLDGALGNVSGLIRQTAGALGARRVDLWGVDFAYRDGQTYARATYPFDLAARGSGRLSPAETRLTAAAYAGPGLERTLGPEGRRWTTTPLLRRYRELWTAPPAPARPVRLAHASAGSRWEAFADDWRRRLRGLPPPAAGVSMQSHVRGLAPEVREDWWALWPLALALHRTGTPEGEAAEAARLRALDLLED